MLAWGNGLEMWGDDLFPATQGVFPRGNGMLI
jgi:hypothetical protein